MGHPEYSQKRLSKMRLDATDAFLFNQMEEIMGAISNRAVFATPSNAVLCIDAKLKPRFFLDRPDVRMLEEPLPDIKKLRHKCAKALRRDPGLELSPETQANDAKLLYWAIDEGVLDWRREPHRTDTGDVLPMSQAVLILEKTKEARSMKYDQSQAFSTALGSLIVFNLRSRVNDKGNNKQMYFDSFYSRLRRLNELLDHTGDDGDAPLEQDPLPQGSTATSDDDNNYEDDEEEETPRATIDKKKKKKGDKKKKKKNQSVVTLKQEEAVEVKKRKAEPELEHAKQKIKLVVTPRTPPIEVYPPQSPSSTASAVALFTPFSFASFVEKPLPKVEPGESVMTSNSLLDGYFSSFQQPV